MASELFGVEGEANSLWSGELAPVEAEERTWNAVNVGLFWVAMTFSLPAYLYASCLSALGASLGAVVGSALAGSLLVVALATGCGHAGFRYGIPFTVLARTAFGVLGTRMPIALRLLVACAWVGIGCWWVGYAVWYALVLLGLLQPSSVLGFWWVVVLLIVALPWKWSRHPFVGVWCGSCLLLFLVLSLPLDLRARGWAFLAPDPSLPVWPVLPAGHGIVLGATAQLGLWLPVAMGASDMTRRLHPQRAHLWSMGAMPVATVLFTGVVAITARMMGGGPYFWNPLLLAIGVTRRSFAVGCLLVFAAAALLSARSLCGWLGGEIAGLMPSRVSVVAGRCLACVLAVFAMPWRLVRSPQVYVGGWLIGCAGLLAPVAAIVLVEYFVVRRRWLNVDDLYQRDGLYEYSAGWNGKAFVALGTGWVVMLAVLLTPALDRFQDGAVWMGTGISALLYWMLRVGPPEVAQIPPPPLLIPLEFEGEAASG